MASDSATGSHGSSENFFNLLRILVVSENMPFLESVSNELMACGSYVQKISSGGLAVELLHKPNTNFNVVLLDASLRSLPPWVILDQIQQYFKNICAIVMTPLFAKRSIDQGASLVIEKERVGSIYYMLWQEKSNLEIKSLKNRRRMVHNDFEHIYRQASADRIGEKIVELMSVLRIYTQSVASYMRIAAEEASASHVAAAPRDPQMLFDLEYLLNNFYCPELNFLNSNL